MRSRDSAEDREEMKLKRMCRQKSYGEGERQIQEYVVLNICVIHIFVYSVVLILPSLAFSNICSFIQKACPECQQLWHCLHMRGFYLVKRLK